MNISNSTQPALDDAGPTGRVAPVDMRGIYAWVREQHLRGGWAKRMLLAAAIRQVNGVEPATVHWLHRAVEIPGPQFHTLLGRLQADGLLRVHNGQVEVLW